MTSKEVTVGEDRDERAGVDASRGAESREGGDAESEIGGDVVGGELSPGEASGAAIANGIIKDSRIGSSRALPFVDARAGFVGVRGSVDC